ncbi:MAG: cereblon family protein [Desulforhopalus sp.]|nr:cereblon family protein [Desulforhopalus sp.]
MELGNNSLLLLRGDEPRHGPPVVKTQRQRATAAMEAIRCRACGAVVTGRDQKILVNGCHAHTFFNPAGIIFELGCFQKAPGCLAVGPSSGEFTWFAGHVWRVTLCRRCQAHLGWLFLSGDNSFFGLILSKLQE